MVSSEKKLENAMGGKTARACDSCIRKRSRWYCAADEAFLCQLCDTLVHSANLLARGHQRVRLKIASLKLSSLDVPTLTWHHGFTKKSRTPRAKNKRASHQTQKSKEILMRLSPLRVVPESESDEMNTTNSDEQIPYEVPEFEPFLRETCLSEDFDDLTTPDYLNSLNGVILPSDLEQAEFAADVESLLGMSRDEETFDVESLGMVDCRIDDLVKVEEDVQWEAVESEIQMTREPFELSFDYDSSVPWEEEDEIVVVKNENEKCEIVCDDRVDIHAENHDNIRDTNKKSMKILKLDYEGIFAAWDDDRSPWTTGDRPELDPNDCWPGCMGGCGKLEHYDCGDMQMKMRGIPIRLDGGREARVSRYKEKRRTRLFSKKIRYEVRKLNAEKRPRMKGRFVKRTSFVA